MLQDSHFILQKTRNDADVSVLSALEVPHSNVSSADTSRFHPSAAVAWSTSPHSSNIHISSFDVNDDVCVNADDCFSQPASFCPLPTPIANPSQTVPVSPHFTQLDSTELFNPDYLPSSAILSSSPTLPITSTRNSELEIQQLVIAVPPTESGILSDRTSYRKILRVNHNLDFKKPNQSFKKISICKDPLGRPQLEDSYSITFRHSAGENEDVGSFFQFMNMHYLSAMKKEMDSHPHNMYSACMILDCCYVRNLPKTAAGSRHKIRGCYSTQFVLTSPENLQHDLQDIYYNIQKTMDTLIKCRSDWILEAINSSRIHMVISRSFGGRVPHFVSLPANIKCKKAVVKINTTEGDKHCFLWCLGLHGTLQERQTQGLKRITNYRVTKHIREYVARKFPNADQRFDFPLNIKLIREFEKAYNMRIMVLGYKKHEGNYYHYMTREHGYDAIPLLYLEPDDDASEDAVAQYFLITDIDRLLNSRKTNTRGFIRCIYCLEGFKSSKAHIHTIKCRDFKVQAT
jgi:hypothetical protein